MITPELWPTILRARAAVTQAPIAESAVHHMLMLGKLAATTVAEPTNVPGIVSERVSTQALAIFATGGRRVRLSSLRDD